MLTETHVYVSTVVCSLCVILNKWKKLLIPRYIVTVYNRKFDNFYWTVYQLIYSRFIVSLNYKLSQSVVNKKKIIFFGYVKVMPYKKAKHNKEIKLACSVNTA